MTHGHELREGNAGGRGCAGWRGMKGRKKWDNCNSMINKIYITKKKINSYRISCICIHELSPTEVPKCLSKGRNLAHVRIFQKGHLVVLTFMSFGIRDVNVTRILSSHLLLYFSLNVNFCFIPSRGVGGWWRVMREAIGNCELYSMNC